MRDEKHEDGDGHREDDALRHIVRKLKQLGIRSLTISEMRGTREEVPLFKHYPIHERIGSRAR